MEVLEAIYGGKSVNSPIVPLGDRVVAVREQAAEKTASGLYLPDNAKEKSIIVKIVAAGKDAKNVKVGDRAVFKEYTTVELTIESTKYIIGSEEDILGTIA